MIHVTLGVHARDFGCSCKMHEKIQDPNAVHVSQDQWKIILKINAKFFGSYSFQTNILKGKNLKIFSKISIFHTLFQKKYIIQQMGANPTLQLW
jgi:hypothetical protein